MESALYKLKPRVFYVPGNNEYVLLPENTIEDVLRHLLSEMQGGKEELLAILETMTIEKE